MAPSTTARPRSTARTARPAPVPASPPSTSTPSWPPPSWRPAISTRCRSPRSSSGRRPGTTSRTARAAPYGAGLLGTAPAWPGSILCILATTSMRDDLYACQPVCEAVLAQGGHFLFTCKPSSHQTLQEYLTGIDLTEHVERVKRGKQRFTHRYRWLCDVPLRGDEEALTVNWLQIEILDAAGAVTYRNSFVTALPVDASSVAELAACGRARWKIENESFNVLKTGGYHLEHNFGHGTAHLSALLAYLNLLAFAIHTVCDLAEGAWRKARTTLGPRVRFFQSLQALTSYLVFSSWTELLHTLAFARPPPSPSG